MCSFVEFSYLLLKTKPTSPFISSLFFSVDLVINFEIPRNSKDYVHRVGRTARAGRSGRAITFVSQYDVELYQRIEALLGKKLPAYAAEQDTVLMLLQRVQEAQRIAIRELKDQNFDGKTVDSAAALEAEVCLRWPRCLAIAC